MCADGSTNRGFEGPFEVIIKSALCLYLRSLDQSSGHFYFMELQIRVLYITLVLQ